MTETDCWMRIEYYKIDGVRVIDFELRCRPATLVVFIENIGSIDVEK